MLVVVVHEWAHDRVPAVEDLPVLGGLLLAIAGVLWVPVFAVARMRRPPR